MLSLLKRGKFSTIEYLMEAPAAVPRVSAELQWVWPASTSCSIPIDRSVMFLNLSTIRTCQKDSFPGMDLYGYHIIISSREIQRKNKKNVLEAQPSSSQALISQIFSLFSHSSFCVFNSHNHKSSVPTSYLNFLHPP